MRTLASPNDRDELIRRLRNVTPDRARRWGTMSVRQMIPHMIESFRMATGELPVRDRSKPFARALLKWFALDAPVRWPHGIPTCPEIDQSRCGASWGDFDADRVTAERLLRDFVDAVPKTNPPRHPTFGRMTYDDWLRWGYLHTDHHLRQFGV